MTKRICDFCNQEDGSRIMYTLNSNSRYEIQFYEGLDICNDCLKLLCQTIKKKRREERCGIVR